MIIYFIGGEKKYILETCELEKKYNKFKALNKLNMNVKDGARKTTLICSLCGIQKTTKGTYSIYGVKNTSKDILKARKGI